MPHEKTNKHVSAGEGSQVIRRVRSKGFSEEKKLEVTKLQKTLR